MLVRTGIVIHKACILHGVFKTSVFQFPQNVACRFDPKTPACFQTHPLEQSFQTRIPVPWRVVHGAAYVRGDQYMYNLCISLFKKICTAHAYFIAQRTPSVSVPSLCFKINSSTYMCGRKNFFFSVIHTQSEAEYASSFRRSVFRQIQNIKKLDELEHPGHLSFAKETSNH